MADASPADAGKGRLNLLIVKVRRRKVCELLSLLLPESPQLLPASVLQERIDRQHARPYIHLLPLSSQFGGACSMTGYINASSSKD